MRHRYLLMAALMLPLGLLVRRFLHGVSRRHPSHHWAREQAVTLDRLASGIRTAADARRYVEFVATIFVDQLPRTWATKALRERVAQSELAAVGDPRKGISEQRVADVWNAYAAAIQAPEESRVSAAEVHSLRDSFFTLARIFWNREHRTIWTVPSLYATQADGSLAPGCRPVEAIRILRDFANKPDNLRGARERVRRGLLASEEFAEELKRPASSWKGSARLEVRSRPIDPIRLAAQQYIAEHGVNAWRSAVARMLEALLAE